MYSGDYDERVDLFAVGGILMEFLCPERWLTNQDFQNPDRSEFKGISSEANDFLDKLLCPQSKRIYAAEALKHPYLAYQNGIKPKDFEHAFENKDLNDDQLADLIKEEVEMY